MNNLCDCYKQHLTRDNMNHILYEIPDYMIRDLLVNAMISINDWVVYINTRRLIKSIELTRVVESIFLIYRFKSWQQVLSQVPVSVQRGKWFYSTTFNYCQCNYYHILYFKSKNTICLEYNYCSVFHCKTHHTDTQIMIEFNTFQLLDSLYSSNHSTRILELLLR